MVGGVTYSSSPGVPRRPLGSASPCAETPASSRCKRRNFSTWTPSRPACFPLTSLWSEAQKTNQEKAPSFGSCAVSSRERVWSPTGSWVLCPGAAPERRHPDRDVSWSKALAPPQPRSQRLCPEKPETLYLGQTVLSSRLQKGRSTAYWLHPPVHYLLECKAGLLCANSPDGGLYSLRRGSNVSLKTNQEPTDIRVSHPL